MSETYNLPQPVPVTEVPFAERTGIVILHRERHRVVLRMPFEPNVNHVGLIYAGALFTAAEVPGGVLFAAAFDTDRFYPIVGKMDVRFIRPATTAVTVDSTMSEDEIVRITDELELSGRSKFVLEQNVKDENDVIVAITTATYVARAF